jgi:signal transduction histidine kinase
MKKANLFILIALLLAPAAALYLLPKWPTKTVQPSGGTGPLELTNATFPEADTVVKNMLDRQLSVQVLRHDDEGAMLNMMDSLFAKKEADNITAREIAASLPDSYFETKDPCCNFIGEGREVYWLRFAVKNASDQRNFLIEVVNPFINNIAYYSLNTLKDTVYKTGTDSTFRARYDSHFRNFLFPAQIARDSTAQFYLRVASDVPLHFRILIFEDTERKDHQQWIVDILMTIFYVFTALFLILLTIVILVSKQRFYWYYFGYVVVTALFIPAHLGLGFMYIWKENGDLQDIVPMALNNLRLILGIQFFRWYFDLDKVSPRVNRFIEISTGIFLFILLLQTIRFIGWVFDLRLTSEVFVLFVLFLALFSLVMLGWLFHEIFFKRRRRFSWLLLVVALNFIGVGITSLQHLGYGSTGYDLSDRVLALFGIANTFFLSPLVIAAFFLEMVLVFNFAVRRYVRLIEINQKNQQRIARDKEENLNALILAAENERKRIARELHDGACVNLAAINMKVDSLKEELNDDPALAQKMADIADDLDATYHEVRGISHDLMSKTLDTTGLETALEELAIRIQQAQKGLTVQFYSNYPLDRVNGLTKIHLYRIAQELLGNVLKHAQATTVNLQIVEDEGNLLLTVEDDGRGFSPHAHNGSAGIGLANVRARVEVLHGKMHLDSSPGKGTFVSVEIPKASIAIG